MIYLIRSGAILEEKPSSILKIGWTDDKNWPKRIDTYYSHNPFLQVLKIFRGYSREVEIALHNKFSHCRIWGNEWYKDCDEIYDFFYSPDIELELKAMIVEGKRIIESKRWKNRLKLLEYIMLLVNPRSPNFSLTSEPVDEEDWNTRIETWSNSEIIKEYREKVYKFNSLSDHCQELIIALSQTKKIENRVEKLASFECVLEDCELEMILDEWVDEELLREYDKSKGL